ncbi:MAG TPA: nucleotide exchange factor GrpE [Patescibacteria group bacterium]|nr:nucleotide exchange factor GrpE [Patescibacteria group bacterium]
MSQDTTPVDGDEFGTLPAEELEARIRELANQLGAARDEQVRLLAEMDNLRKRAARDVDSARKFGVEKLLNDLMPVCDGLEMGLSQGGSDPLKLREGMDLTLKLLLKASEQHGLTRLNPVGEAFNPEWHQAMAMVPTGNQPAGTVLDVFQTGYRLHERLIRPAMVTIASDPLPPEDA